MKSFIWSAIFFVLISNSTYSQLSSYSFQSTSGTFTSVTGGTVLGTISNDEQVFNNNTTGGTAPVSGTGFPIGFSFYYNGVIYDKFAVSTNGWILLGKDTFSIGASSTPISNLSNTGFANIISALGRDLQGQTGSELSYKLTGDAPNRIMVVQWLGYRRYNSTGDNFNFQIRLKESNSGIDFVYGSVITSNTSTANTSNPTQTGIRGAANTDFNNRTTTTSWSASTAGTLNNSTMRHSTTVYPASGLTYSLVPGNMTYSSSTTIIADTSSVSKNSVNNPIIKVQVVVSGLANPISVTSFTLNTTGTTNTADITNAKLWYTGTNNVFSASTQFGSVVSAPNGSYSVTGTQQLSYGTNYFWLTYDVPITAVTANKIDGGCSSVTVVTPRTPTVTAPAGSRTIASMPLSGNYNVGLALFNKVSGKELYFKKQTTKVNREIYIQGDNYNTKKAPSDFADFAGGLKKINAEEDQDSFILMDGDAPYTGAQLIKVTPELRNKFGNNLIPDNVNGIYANITTAINDLNVSGIQGPVVFYLTDASYSSETFPLVINNITGSSAVNTFTLKPALNNSVQITMSTGTSMLKIYKSSYITIDGSNTVNGNTRNLTFTSNYSNISSCIWIGSSGTTPENDISVINCILKTGENSLASTPVIVSDGDIWGATGYFSNITINNNIFSKGKQGVFINGGSVPQNISNVNVTNNVLNSTGLDAMGFMGIYLQGVVNAAVSGNEISNFNAATDENDKGIWIALGSQNVTAERNKIYNLGYTQSNGNGAQGIYLSPNHINSAIEVRNNSIYNIYGDGWSYTDATYFLDNPAGIAMYSLSPQSGINIFNNSINLYGNTLNHTLALSSGIFISTGSTADIRNNVIVNNLGLTAEIGYGSSAIFAQNSITQFSNIDYNNYFVNPTGNGVKIIGKISTTTNAADINSWRTATGKDRSSINYSPGFTSNTNLVPDPNNQNSWSLNGRGNQIASVMLDANNNVRSTTVPDGGPDIGAYEFTPAMLPVTVAQTGTIINGGTTKYIFGGDTVASIVWHGATLPASVVVKYYSGINPPNAGQGNFGNCYWTFTPTGGSGYTFDLTLYYDPSLIGTITPESNVSMANYTSSVWTHYAATVNTALRTINYSGLGNLTTFTIDDLNSPLPVNLKYFNSVTSSRDVILKWATDYEVNNSGFEIQRKQADQGEWLKIGFVKGAGTVSGEHDYSFTDSKLNIGEFSYRIKQTDYSGNFELYNLSSDVIIGKPVSFGMSQNYPNPSNPVTKIDYQIPNDGIINIKVYDTQGKEVMTIADGFVKAGYYTAVFDGSNLASGVYFYRLITSGMTKTMRMILLK